MHRTTCCSSSSSGWPPNCGNATRGVRLSRLAAGSHKSGVRLPAVSDRVVNLEVKPRIRLSPGRTALLSRLAASGDPRPRGFLRPLTHDTHDRAGPRSVLRAGVAGARAGLWHSAYCGTKPSDPARTVPVATAGGHWAIADPEADMALRVCLALLSLLASVDALDNVRVRRVPVAPPALAHAFNAPAEVGGRMVCLLSGPRPHASNGV